MLDSFLPQSMIPLTASSGFPRFVLTVLGRDFADLVQLCNTLSHPLASPFPPIDHSTFPADCLISPYVWLHFPETLGALFDMRSVGSYDSCFDHQQIVNHGVKHLVPETAC
jgi:hypothetical protein